MADKKFPLRFFGIRVPYGSSTRVDKVVAVDASQYFAGMLEVFEVHQNTVGVVQTISTSMVYKFGGTSSNPYLLTKLEVLNPNAGAAAFSLAMMTTPSGSPTVANAFLAWNTAVAGNSVFTWTGAVPLIDRYIYAQASISGLLLYRDLKSIVPK